tara:strand:+ start:67 stop:303 length:237 start_codon:yes stop_codon:yes gene_type:complete
MSENETEGNYSRNRKILIVIGVFVAIFLVASNVDIKIETKVGTDEYATEYECVLKEMQQCPSDCRRQAKDYCEELDLP